MPRCWIAGSSRSPTESSTSICGARPGISWKVLVCSHSTSTYRSCAPEPTRRSCIRIASTVTKRAGWLASSAHASGEVREALEDWTLRLSLLLGLVHRDVGQPVGFLVLLAANVFEAHAAKLHREEARARRQR